jgi:hypothetical protein
MNLTSFDGLAKEKEGMINGPAEEPPQKTPQT